MILSTNPNYEAETQVLGSVIQDSKIMDKIGMMLESHDFEYDTHQIIWHSMKWKWENDEPIDLISLTETLGKTLDSVGGVGYLSDMMLSVPSVEAAPRYAKKIKKKAIRKRTKQAGETIIRLSEESEDDQQMFSMIEKIISTIQPGTGPNMKSVQEVRKDYFEYLDTADDFILTGFKRFDEWMGGLGRGWLYILAGRPSAGKTAKALQMAAGIAKSGAGDVLLWSQEMTRNQVLSRMLSTISQVNGNRIRRKVLQSEEKTKLNKAYDELEKLPLHIDDASGITIEEIRTVARQMKRKKKKIGAIIVDYLGIMKIRHQQGETRAQAIGYVTRTAKEIAKEIGCPFILLAQMNREGAKQEEPDLSNLKESGDIEQDADIVEFVYEADEKNPNGKVVIGKIAKGRDVGVNKFKYLFKGWIQKYEEFEG